MGLIRMISNIKKKSIFVIVVVFVIGSYPWVTQGEFSAVLAEAENNGNRTVQLGKSSDIAKAIPVVIRASALSLAVRDVPLPRLSVMTYRDGRLAPIPFQIDEMDTTGLVYTAHKKQARLLGEPGLFDGEDEVVFMLGDAAMQAAPLAVIRRHQVLETVEVGVPASADRAVVYLVLDNEQRDTTRYVASDLVTGTVETESLKLTFDPAEFSDMNAVQLKGPNGAMADNILDDLSLKVSTGILNKNMRVSARLGKDITLKPLTATPGPVRATLLLEVRFRFLGLTLHRDYVGVNFYRRSVNIPTRFTTSSLRSARLFMSLLRQPRLEFDVSFSGLQGSTLHVDSYVTPGRVYRGVIDGQVSAQEQQANTESLPGDFIWLASPQGWHGVLTNTLPVVPGGLFDSYLEGLNIQVHYEDVADPADALQARVTLEGIPKPALTVLFEINRLRLDRTENLAALLARVVEQDRAGRLKALDRLNQKIIAQRIAQGLIAEPADYGEAFIQDFDRIALQGVPRSELNLALRRAMQSVESLDALRQMRLADMATALQVEAARLELDLSLVSRASIDNTIWFAQTKQEIDPMQYFEAASQLIFAPHMGVASVAESGTAQSPEG